MYNTDLPNRAELPSSARLLRSTIVAVLVAAGLLVTTILPAEYGIDPTGIGRILGLTRMGEIKMSLAAEARNAEASPQTGAATAPAGVQRPQTADAASAPKPVTESRSVAQEVQGVRQDTTTIRLKPGAAAEVKLVMRKDARVRYEWSSAGGPVNYDTHGDIHNAPKDFYHGYGKGRNETANAGTLQAAFDGKHGWFWRNRSGAEVTITLKTDGEYDKIDRVL